MPESLAACRNYVGVEIPGQKIVLFLVWCIWSGAAWGLGVASCDAPTPIHFNAGASSAEVTGAVARGERACFTFEARRGQHMSLSQPGQQNSNVVVQIYRPQWTIDHSPDGIIVRGQALRGAAEGDDTQAWAGILPAAGKYLLVLGTSWGGGEYRVRVAIR